MKLNNGLKKRPPAITILTKMVKDGYIETLGPYAWAVYNVLLAFADWKTGGNCYPSYSKIMELTGFSKQTVCNAIKKLEASGEVLIMRHNSPLKHKRNLYTIRRIAEK